MENHIGNEELHRDAPFLAKLPKSDPFQVEAGFFDRFPHEVQALAARPAPSSWIVWVKRAAVALPAMAILLFAIHSLRPSTDKAHAEMPDDDLLLSSLADQMGTDDILEAADTDEWPEFSTVSVQLTPEEALAYVDNNQIDLYEYLN